jgi:antitoxin StbD
MNAPFKPDLSAATPVEPIFARACVSISAFKKNPAAVITAAQTQEVAILNRNKPVAYLIAPHVWEHLCDLVEDEILMKTMDLRQDEIDQAIMVSFDDL